MNTAIVSEFHRTEFDKIVEFINGGESLDGNELRRSVAQVDTRREQDLRTHHAELADAIDYKGPQK